ncbi:MAG: sigma-70 family RNA polymerase sigma factor [bacterium]|nr:sigma-70 family RNA polymerase sigma factor [bacterium]
MHQYGFKFRPSDIGDLINFKASPLDRGGEYSERCLDLESALGIDVEELFPRELYEKIKVSKQVIEIDSVAALPTVVRRHMEALPAPAEESPVVRAIASELREQLERALKTLKHREREVLRLRYGIDCEPHTLEQVGKIFNVSKEVIRQVEMRAIRKLQHPSRARKIEYL